MSENASSSENRQSDSPANSQQREASAKSQNQAPDKNRNRTQPDGQREGRPARHRRRRPANRDRGSSEGKQENLSDPVKRTRQGAASVEEQKAEKERPSERSKKGQQMRNPQSKEQKDGKKGAAVSEKRDSKETCRPKGEKKSDERKGGRSKNQRGGNRPLISIITITYNASRELEPTMKSIREQTFKNFEHLIIDGASTDDTIITARLYKSPNLRVYSEPDEGLYDAMNKGLRLARGRYVLFMNAGDTFHSPDSLARYANAAENNNADIVYGDTVIVNEERKVLRPRHLSVPGSLTSRSFLKGMLICHQALMVKKEIAPEYDLRYRFSADYDWAIKVINKSRPGKRINLQTVTTDYLDAGLTEKNKIRSLRERFKVMSEHYGTGAALMAHLSFIPRALGRRLGKK